MSIDSAWKRGTRERSMVEGRWGQVASWMTGSTQFACMSTENSQKVLSIVQHTVSWDSGSEHRREPQYNMK